ncbi:hypothetical protein MRB53_022328 [Persea americana]|uniref:Uncharacterized protein n=1 Tax=Persea americana TaxID=3435 RepID=A0ACC2L6N0_PERAE|nr:hypothetical protein MRB53_022328 [Persea americana]
MLDGLLNRGFSSKCKSSIKLLRCRIEIVKRKRNSMIRLFKTDISELLKSGLDLNAYGRAEGLIVEMNLYSGYDLVDQFCGSISGQLSSMQKERKCPKECREAVSSLSYAAARFADLPELRELRSIFTERYGNMSASSVNIEFAQKLATEPPSMEQKLHLMQEIAQEFSIDWDSKALKEMISTPLVTAQDPPKKFEPSQDSKDEKVTTMDKKDFSSHGEQESTLGTRFTTREDVNTDSKDIHSIKNKNDPIETKVSNQEEPPENVKPRLKNIIPPYVKPRGSKYGSTTSDISEGDSIANKLPDQDHSVIDSKPKPRSVRRRPLKPPAIDNDTIAVGTQNDSGSSNDQKTHVAQECISTSFSDHVERIKERFSMNIHRRSNQENSKLNARLNAPHHVADASNSLSSRKDDAACSNLDSVPAHTRAISLPPEPLASTKVAKIPVRAATFHPDDSSEEHIHPKLPDYDDLAARFASLKGRCKG